MERRGPQPWKTERARVLRNGQTLAEARLWAQLRNRQLDGLKFVRQLPILDYFADFACRENRVIVEVDGATHGTSDELAYDGLRTAALTEAGWRVFRVDNADVSQNLDGVLEALLAVVRESGASGCPSPQPSPPIGGEGVSSTS